MKSIFIAALILVGFLGAATAESGINYKQIPGGRIITMNNWDSRNPNIPLTSDARLVVNDHYLNIHASNEPFKFFGDDRPIGPQMFDKVSGLDYDRVMSRSGLYFVVLVEAQLGVPNNYWVVDVSGPDIELSPEIKGCVTFSVGLVGDGASLRCSHGRTMETHAFVHGKFR